MMTSANTDALNVIGVSQQVAANNLANVNTNEFRASRTYYETGPQGQGVRLQDIRETSARGAMVPTHNLVESDSGRIIAIKDHVESSNTDVAREMVQLMRNQHAYAANARAITSQDTILGTVVNGMV